MMLATGNTIFKWCGRWAAVLAVACGAIGNDAQTAAANGFGWARPRTAYAYPYTAPYAAGYAPYAAAYAPYTAGYAPSPYTAGYAPAGCATCTTTCTQRVCQYVPYTTYRIAYQPVAITSYQPVTTSDPCSSCTTTCMRPVVQYVQRAYYVPQTAYQLSCRDVTTTTPSTMPTAAPTTAQMPIAYAPPVASPCATCNMASPATYNAPGYAAPSGAMPGYGAISGVAPGYGPGATAGLPSSVPPNGPVPNAAAPPAPPQNLSPPSLPPPAGANMPVNPTPPTGGATGYPPIMNAPAGPTSGFGTSPYPSFPPQTPPANQSTFYGGPSRPLQPTEAPRPALENKPAGDLRSRPLLAPPILARPDRTATAAPPRTWHYTPVNWPAPREFKPLVRPQSGSSEPAATRTASTRG